MVSWSILDKFNIALARDLLDAPEHRKFNIFVLIVYKLVNNSKTFDQLFSVCAGWRAVTARYELLKVDQLPLLEAEVIQSMCWRFTSQSFQQYRHNLHPKITQLLRLDSARDRTPEFAHMLRRDCINLTLAPVGSPFWAP